MSDWWDIQDLLDRTFSLWTAGQTIGADGDANGSPVLKVANIQGSIQCLSGNEYLKYGKDLIEGTHYFICLQELHLKNGDILIDDFGIKYRIIWWEDENVVTGRYLSIIGKVLRE